MKYLLGFLSLVFFLPLAARVTRAQNLPAVRIDAETQSSDLPAPEKFPSPDGRLLLTTQKYVTSIGVAILYKRVGGEWQSATVNGQRFDEAAWRWWAGRKKGRMVPSLDDGPRLLRFTAWSPDGRFLDFALQGKSVPPARMRYHTRTGAFALR